MIAVNQNMGMNQDLSPINPEYEKFYYEAQNVTIIFDKQSNQFILSNEGGNTGVFVLPNINVASSDDPDWNSMLTVSIGTNFSTVYYNSRPTSDFAQVTPQKSIIGHALGDNELYLLSTNGTQDQIWRFDYAENFDATEELTLVWAGVLGWQTTDRLKVELNYENEDIVRLYIADGKTCIRTINVAKALNINTLDHPLNFAPKALDSSPKVWLPQLQITNTYRTGNFAKGVVQYTYCLYNRNGNITKVAPFSFLATIAKSGRGHDISEKGNSSFELTLSNLDTAFTKLRIFRIHYSESNATTVTEIYNGTHDGSFKIVDTGASNIASLTLSELLNIGSVHYVPKTFEIQDNILYLGNVQEEEIDLSSYDTRAYRYKRDFVDPYAICQIYPHDNSSTADKTFSGNTYPNLTTELELDCTNFSDYSYDTSDVFNNLYVWKNKSSLIITQLPSNLGATGPNVEVSFERIPISRITSYEGHNYKYRHYKSNEIYRLGVRFITDRNAYSDVKWILDLRIPDFRTLNRICYIDASANIITSDGKFVVVPKVTLNNLDTLPSNIVGYQIVRCIRDSKNILDQGFINPAMYNPKGLGKIYTPHPCTHYKGSTTLNYTTVNPHGVLYNDDYVAKPETFQIYCPRQIILNDTSLLEADLSQLIGVTGANTLDAYYKLNSSFEGTEETDLDKISATTLASILSIYQAAGVYGVSGGEELWFDFQEGIDSMTKYMISGSTNIFTEVAAAYAVDTSLEYLALGEKYEFANFIGQIERIEAVGRSFYNLLYILNEGPIKKTVSSRGGATIVVSLTGSDEIVDFDSASAFTGGSFIVDLIKVNTEQYGGRSYQARKNSQYIPASEVTRITGSSHSAFVINGDTFISEFNYHRIIPVPTLDEVRVDTSGLYSDGNITYGEFKRIYQETDLNLELREDRMIDYPKEVSRITEEDQLVYTYKEIYNREDNTITYRAESDLVKEVSKFRYLVRYSDTKFYNEPYDSFLSFSPNNFNECPSNLGEITNLISLNNLLYCYQVNGTGYWIVNPNAIASTSAGNILIGKGEVLQQHVVLDDKNGTSHFNSVIKGNRGIYSLDTNSKKFIKISGGKEPAISDVKGLYKYLTNRYPINNSGLIVSLGYDSQNFNVYCSIIDTNTPANSTTFSYNEFSDSFVSFHSYVADRYISDRERFYSIASPTVHEFSRNSGWIHNYTLSTTLYNQSRDWFVTYISNKDPLVNKLYSIFEYKLEVLDENGAYIPFLSNFDDYQMWVENQDTGVILLSNPRVASKYNNKWRAIVKRDINSRDQKGRINNSYVYLKLKTKDSSQKKYKLYPLIVHYEHLIY